MSKLDILEVEHLSTPKLTREEAEALTEAIRREARRSRPHLSGPPTTCYSVPDLGERLCLAAARIRPELYIWEREQLGGESNG